jgi:hypothetical protein
MAKDRTAAARQRRRREKLAKMALRPVVIKFSETERVMLDEARTMRGGSGDPYDVEEYLALLIRRDHEAVTRLLSEVGQCNECGERLPMGCGGVFDGSEECERAAASRRLAI